MKVVRRGAAIVAVGCLVGLGGAAGLTRLLSSLLYEVAPVDAPAFAGAALTLLFVGTAAALVPGVRASGADPAALLRQE